MGPLLFLIFIDDLPNATNFFVKFYADDTFLCSENEDISKLQSEVNFELQKVSKWLTSNQLTLNVKKSKFMILSRKKEASSNFTLEKINNIRMEKCDSYKYLGVFFDKDLNWKAHIDYVCKKISKSCGCLAKLRNCLDIETLREVYHALIHSYLRYGITVWGSASQTALDPVKVLVNRAIRIMCFAPSGRIDFKPLFDTLEILNVEQVYKLELGKFMFKKQNNTIPLPIANYFEHRDETQHYKFRARHVPQASTLIYNSSYGARSVQIKSLETWDDIPAYLKASETVISFKRNFKSHLFP